MSLSRPALPGAPPRLVKTFQQVALLLEAGFSIYDVSKLLGHARIETTMIYTHVLNRGGRGVRSPLDRR